MRRWRAQLSIFLAAYLLYDAARWIFSSDLGQARAHAEWVIYRALRNTVIATWLIAVPIFALFPVAPPRLAGIGIAALHAPWSRALALLWGPLVTGLGFAAGRMAMRLEGPRVPRRLQLQGAST
jgi:hypothetical protein